ncbi:ABC transporter ATP-binding protein [Devosia albogilva]|uniref:ABC transporter ATP-binding protein n=1 Tax=Devosia albogilva TaxID=429726 RepID=A0ABW5QP92_9HYPH
MDMQASPSATPAGSAAVGAPLVAAQDLCYSLELSGETLHILRNVSLRVEPAEVVAVVGPSGSGKTSLLMQLAGLERPTSGRVTVAGTELTKLSEDQLAEFRRDNVGIIFQSFHLIPSLTALDNVALALEIASPQLPLAEVRNEAAAALAAVGLGERLTHRPSAMSGGEQQRVGIARALVTKPRLLLADEPTGNLDQTTGLMVIELIFELARRQDTAVVLITHDPALAKRADRMVTMSKGVLSETPAAPAVQ